ncbi:glycosyltransferase involved in cell wall biosynthesis [Paenibacillus sp. PastF-3]|uniref:glycosyltransferase family 2 protein n=1 Tax=Paenibacillus sp. PastF-3 TaxID=2940626 RepID=UPI0024745536|nr:glycosyltransferase family 2 protein [Paenibacillus sp. PastF-3]MDH6373268.1 glycosyltransferase involved in cell wall biosynthesis [Paenibacillus sp. PastF-3]
MDQKVSVIIPTYKRSDFLLRAIDSVLNQTYLNIEIIVIDDNEPRSNFRVETELKMKKFSNNPKIIYIKNLSNLGGALARNEGILRSTGEYITFLDDDDIYINDKISTQIEFMVKNDLDMSFTDVRIHSENDKLIDFREHSYIKSLTNKDLLKYHLMYHLTPTPTYMYRKKLLLQIGCFDDVSMGQEFRLMLKTLNSSAKIGYLPISRVIQYVHSGERISVGNNKLKKESELFQYKKNFFNILTRKEQKYIWFRHHLVLCVVGIRSKKFMVFLKNLFLLLILSPTNLSVELLKFRKKLKNNKTY